MGADNLPERRHHPASQGTDQPAPEGASIREGGPAADDGEPGALQRATKI